MIQVTFTSPHRTVLEVPIGTTLLEAARLAGRVLESPCNGAGVCEKCRIRVVRGLENIELTEKKCRLPEADRRAGWVLACHARVQGNVEVTPDSAPETGHQILSGGQAVERPLNPWIRKRYHPEQNTTVLLAGTEQVGTEKGDTSREAFGLAIDIGTTTVVVALVDLLSGRELGSLSAINPQTAYGHDVLSRIQFGSDPEGLRLLQKRLIDELNRMIEESSRKFRIPDNRIYEAVFSGNTTMLHLALGVNPQSLGRYPYIPTLRGGQTIRAQEVGLNLSETGWVYLPPIFDAYVGADISSGVLATALNRLEGITLFIDIGTNGEMILANQGHLYATSTAAGPAFEGMNIACGMRAAEGAIESFEIQPEGRIKIETIGQVEPIGICGSGLIDIVGELAAHGVIDASGRFDRKNLSDWPPDLAERLQPHEGKPAFMLSESVFLTQKDIRQVQLAKGAIRAGIDALLALNGVSPEQVDRVLIAGSFGFHLRTRSLVYLGLLPEAFGSKVEFVGNTSQSGAQAFLLDQSARDEILQVVGESESADLAHTPDFEKLFVQSLAFPKKTESERILVAVTGS